MEENLSEVKELVKSNIENKKYSNLHEIIHKLNSQDISLLFEDLSKEDMVLVFRLLSKDEAAEVFSYMDSDLQENLISLLTDKELKGVIDELFMDDTVDLIEEMPSNVVKRILKTVNQKDRNVINKILNYPEDSAGSIMTTEFVDLKESMTVKQAFERIKKIAIDKETVYTCYVLNSSRKMVGIVGVKDLLIANESTLIKDIMETNLVSVNTLDDQEEVVKKFDKYDFIALPVVDKEERLVGIVTIDDAMDVMQEENTEDFKKMAAITPSEETYFKTSVIKHSKNRILWLLLLMLSSSITGTIIIHYEEAFAVLPLLVAFVPMLMDTGGNCGSQSSTMIIRGMATDEIKLKDYFKTVWKELRIALIVGIILSIVNGARIVLQYHNVKIATVVGLTLILTVIMSKFLGCSLPMLAKKLKLDPAIMAAPLITTIVDSCSILIYFQIAVALMRI